MNRWLICIVFLAGCVSYEPRPISPALSESSLRARSLTDPQLVRIVEQFAGKPENEWTPAQLDLVAFYYNPAVEEARARVGAAEAAIRTAGERPNPVLSVTPEYAISPEGALSPWIVGVTLDIPIETAGKRRIRTAHAQALWQAARFSFAETIWRVHAQVRTALTDYNLLLQEINLLKREIELRTKLAEAGEQRLRAGEISGFEANLARTDLITATVAGATVSASLQDAHSALASALGLPALPEVGFRPTRPADSPLRNSFEELQTAGLMNRFDVRRALAEYKAAEKSLQLEIARQYPDVHLTPGYQFDQGTHKFALGPSVTLPVFNQNQGPIAEAVARRALAAAAFESIQLQAIQDTARGWSRYTNAAALLQQTQAALHRLQEKADAAARQNLAAGETDRPTLLAAQLQLLAIARANLEATRRFFTARLALENALQYPLDSEQRWDIQALLDLKVHHE